MVPSQHCTQLPLPGKQGRKWPIGRNLGRMDSLKVSKRENFELAIFTLSDPIWEGDSGTEAKNKFFYQFGKKFLVVGSIWAHIYAYYVFFEKI